MKLARTKRPARGQEEASKRPARGQQEASKKPARGRQEASNKPARGQTEAPNRGDPTKQPKPLKNKHFHEETSPVLRALRKTDFLEKSSWGSLKLAKTKRQARGQEEDSKRPGRGTKWGGPHETQKPLKNKHFHEENSPVLGPLKNRFSGGMLWRGSQQEARKRTARGQTEAPNGGDPTKHRNH